MNKCKDCGANINDGLRGRPNKSGQCSRCYANKWKKDKLIKLKLASEILKNFANPLICKKCKKQFFNYEEIGKHAVKEHHYEYNNPKSKLTLAVV